MTVLARANRCPDASQSAARAVAVARHGRGAEPGADAVRQVLRQRGHARRHARPGRRREDDDPVQAAHRRANVMGLFFNRASDRPIIYYT